MFRARKMKIGDVAMVVDMDDPANFNKLFWKHVKEGPKTYPRS
jgi:AraC-like DNA-binding protein